MLRESKNLAYGEILKMELNTALNKVGDADFELGVKEILMKPSKTSRLGLRPNPGFKKEVSDQEVQKYFEENKWAQKIDLDIVENSLLPTRHFFKRFTDSIRVYINETSSPQEEIRDAVKLEVRECLRAEGIDMRDKTVTVPLAREYIDKKLRHENYLNEMLRRNHQLMSDKKLRDWYYSGINKELAKLQDKQVFYNKVNQKIHKIFENAYFERLNNIYEKSKEAQSLEKRRMFIKMKKFLIKQRIMGYMTHENERLSQQIKSMPYKMLHMQENWEQTHRDVEHPEIKKTVMWHLSKVVGKASLAPNELVKDYLSNPEVAKQMQCFVFDKKQLQALQKDILENPEKYEEMLNQSIDEDWDFLNYTDHGDFFKQRLIRSHRQEHWFRLNNDGQLPINEDNWPMRKAYYNYKNWADNIKTKALGTLRYTVTRLIADFENTPETGNHIQNFQKDAKESKMQSLQRLLIKLNEQGDSLSQVATTRSFGQKQSLNQQKRPMGQVERDFFNLIEQDSELSALFGKQGSRNPLVKSMRKEMLGELYQLVETSLLSQSNMTKESLEKRLAQLINPKNIQKDKTAALNLIDSYLVDQSSQTILKETVEYVKPFFLQVYNEKLEEETNKVLNAFAADETSEEVLEFYLACKQAPELFEGSFKRKLDTFHPSRHLHQLTEKLYPLDSKKYAYKHLLNQFGQTDAKAPEDILAQVKQDQAQFAEVNRVLGLPDEEIDMELQRRRERELKVPFDEEALPDEELINSSFTMEELDNAEQMARKITDAKLFIEKHQHEILTSLNHADWLEVYSDSIDKFNMDMDAMVKSNRDPQAFYYELELGKSQLEQAKELFNVKNLSWEELSEYATYLKGLEKAKVSSHENVEKIFEFMTIDEEEENYTRESIYRGLIQQKYDPKDAKTKDEQMREKISNQKSLQQKIKMQSQKGLECLKLASYAPKEMRETVHNMISNPSKYLDYDKLISFLAQRDYSEDLNPQEFINNEALLKDIHNGSALKEFMQKYKDITLDVVSLAEIRAMSDKLLEKDKESELLCNIKVVLDHVDEQMAFISNDRRQQITLGEFMTRHHYMNVKSFRQYSSDLLKSQIEEALGKSDEAKTSIDWELEGIVSHPDGIGEDVSELDQRLQETAADGMSSEQILTKLKVYDESTGLTREETDLLKVVYQEARKATMLSPEMESLRHVYENQMLREYTKENYDAAKIESMVAMYLETRLRGCQLKKEFAQAMKSPHAYIFVKTLKERVMEELSLDESSVDELQWEQLNLDEQPREYLAESKYNLNHLNNDEAIGYNNLEQRALNPESNKELAHETLFDQMLADYFLQKRGDYKKSNKLMSDLETIFDTNNKDGGHPMNNGQDTLGFHYLRQAVGKEEAPELIPYNFAALMDLDIAVNRRLHDNKSGLSQELRDMQDEYLKIPEYYEINDVRKPADVYVNDKLQDILNQLFQARRKLEKHLSRGELVAYDKVLSKYLTHDMLYEKLKREVYKDYNELEQFNQMTDHNKDLERDDPKQLMKTRNHQPEFNKGIVNEDAFFKHIAYTGLLEKKRKDNRKETLEDPVLAAGYDTFQNYYMNTLMEDAKRPARQIDESAFEPKKQTKFLGTSDREDHGFLDMRARRDLFLDEHVKYKENKLEQTERIQTYYILEQFFEQQRQNPVGQDSPLHKAQEHIREYFNQPENTQFFDRSRIN